MDKRSIPVKDEALRSHPSAEQNETIAPAFPGGSEAIVFCLNDYYCPYFSVMLYSVVEHALPLRQYDIIVLHRDITAENQRILVSMTAGRDNISLRFRNVSARIEGYTLYTGGKSEFTVDAYLRLLIPYVLDEAYKKALYLDADMLALTDVGALLDTDLTGYMLASSRDLCGLAIYYNPRDKYKQNRDTVLHLTCPDDYFIDGMLVMNLDAFRRAYTADDLLRLAASRDWLQHDQDVLNLLCNGGKAKLVHAKWDVLQPYRPELLPEAARQELAESLEDPKILHFGGGDKPWQSKDSLWTEVFWDTAIKTPYCKALILRALPYANPDQKSDEVFVRINNGKIRLRHLLQYNVAWLRFKVRQKLLKKHL